MPRPTKCLYKTSSNREVPRVLTIYDIGLTVPAARQAVRNLFLNNADVEDKRVVDMLVEKVSAEHI